MKYSYSGLSMFEECKRKWKYHYVDKVPVNETDKYYLVLGSTVHEALEHEDVSLVLNDGVAYHMYKTGVEFLKTIDVRAKELKLGIDSQGLPVAFDSPDVKFRGVIDILTKDGSIYDWKTGYKKPSPRQLYMYMLLAGAHGYNVNSVGYIMLRTNEIDIFPIDVEAFNASKAWLVKTIQAIEAETEFQQSVSNRCEYCPYVERCIETAYNPLQKYLLLKNALKNVEGKIKEAVLSTGEDFQFGDYVYGMEEKSSIRCVNKKALAEELKQEGLFEEYSEVVSGSYNRLLEEHPEYEKFFKSQIRHSYGLKETTIS